MIHNYVIFASYGNDSIALIQWARERGLSDAVVAYSDTGWGASWWPDRVQRAEAWALSLGFDTVRIESEGMAELVRRKKAWPRGGGGRYQFCTKALKQEPAEQWLAEADPECEATCLVGIRREESASRRQWPEWTEESPAHGGRSLWAPPVRYTERERDELIAKTSLQRLSYRSKECWPCVNARKGEIALLESDVIDQIRGSEFLQSAVERSPALGRRISHD